ncbi:MAG: DNA mismatch repair endonuclease MutL, partial [Cyclobacteriaceae bacterium]|nr:DNA mismatch repair endonuclease MutL [Cyclobacteriaceae bacterium]
MPDIIRLLPDKLANQIAAGEVVQRPASVVKELLENAIDAGATSIEVIIKDAGKALIQVVDNGKGMSETDARMSLERHATSKISSSDDLFNIRTMGFRGEALASIAAVSHMELKTKQAGEKTGTLIEVEASKIKTQEPCAMNEGTSISVKNLFYNIPARRNFLKSNSVESGHIIDEFQHIALGYPELSFLLFQNDTETYHLPQGKLSQRIVNLFGKSYQEQLAACNTETELIQIKGYVGRPESARKTRGQQFLFVNGRFIRNPYLNHAVISAYEGMLPEKYFPFYVLFITVPPEQVDVNVHPTKTEVKFEDERSVYAIVRAGVKQALGAHNLSPTIDFTANVNLMEELKRESSTTAQEKNYGQFRKKDTANWEKMLGENLRYEGRETEEVIHREGDEHLTFSSAINSPEETLKPSGTGNSYIHLFKKYILAQVKSGVMMVDHQAAHERILYEKMLAYYNQSKSYSQHCLFPQSLDLNPGDFNLVME